MTWKQIKTVGRFEQAFQNVSKYAVTGATMVPLYLKVGFQYDLSWWWVALPFAIYFPLWTAFCLGVIAAKNDVWNSQCKEK